MVARFSGDKFGIILSDLLTRLEATSFADRLAKRLAEPYTLDGRQVFTSAKIGIAYGNSKYPEAEDILRDAESQCTAKDNQKYVLSNQKRHTRVTRLQSRQIEIRDRAHEFALLSPLIGLNMTLVVSRPRSLDHPQRARALTNHPDQPEHG